MLRQFRPGSPVLGAPAWLGFVVVVAAVVAAAAVEFRKTVGHEAAMAPIGHMQFVSSASADFVTLADVLDPLLEKKRAAKFEELPAQF